MDGKHASGLRIAGWRSPRGPARLTGDSSRLVLHLLCAALAGCGSSTCQGVNANVSVPAANRNDPDIAQKLQSETSMVRIDDPRSPPSAQGRIFVIYTDESTRNSLPVETDTSAWTNGASIDGWAYSDDGGSTWHVRPQIHPPAPLEFLWGNSYVAAYGTTALWVSLALGPDADGVPTSLAGAPPNYLIIDRMHNAGITNPDPQFEPVQILAGPFDSNHAPDGPKIAITRDGNAAMVVWQTGEGNIAGHIANYKVISSFEENSALQIPSDSLIGTIDPASFATAPGRCYSYQVAPHPIVAGGLDDFYVAMQFQVAGVNPADPTCTNELLNQFPGYISSTFIEVYRYRLSAPMHRWERILSVVAPEFDGGGEYGFIGRMVGSNVLSSPNVLSSTRHGARPTLTVGRSNGHDVVLVATEKEEDVHDNPAAMTHEKVVLWRLPDADICDPSSDDGKSCGDQVLQDVEVDQGQPVALGKPVPQPAMAPPGVWEYQPALYNGFGSGGDLQDPRVGIIWYAQPLRGLANATDAQKSLTIVESMWSNDAGLSFHGPLNLTLAAKELPSAYPPDKVLGQYFVPCQSAGSGYFGDYISGVFSRHDVGSTNMVGTWADSREGCYSQQGPGNTVYHQHVYSGDSTPQLVEAP